MSLSLLAHLWLHEPGSEAVGQAERELGLPAADAAHLAPAYADALLLNVYPYGTAYTDPWGELNEPEAQTLARLYAAYGYVPPELNAVAAPDHLGLCLGFLAHTRQAVRVPGLLGWAPVCCLAVEREPTAHPFYKGLAARTREQLLAGGRSSPAGENPDEPVLDLLPGEGEVGLREVLRFWLSPARCGLFLSRTRLGEMAQALGLRLPFGSRLEVAEWLFTAAGEAGQLPELLTAVDTEAEAWTQAYSDWSQQYLAWTSCAAAWLGRVGRARQWLAKARSTVESEL